MKIFKSNNILLSVEILNIYKHLPAGKGTVNGSSNTLWGFAVDVDVRVGKIPDSLNGIDNIDSSLVDIDNLPSTNLMVSYEIEGPPYEKIEESFGDILTDFETTKTLIIEAIAKHHEDDVDSFKQLLENNFINHQVFADNIESWVEFVNTKY